jgi:hypothetical protein
MLQVSCQMASFDSPIFGVMPFKVICHTSVNCWALIAFQHNETFEPRNKIKKQGWAVPGKSLYRGRGSTDCAVINLLKSGCLYRKSILFHFWRTKPTVGWRLHIWYDPLLSMQRIPWLCIWSLKGYWNSRLIKEA